MSTGDSAAGGRAEAGASEAVQGGAQQAGSGGAGVGETRDVLLWEARGSAPRSWELELEYGTMVMHVVCVVVYFLGGGYCGVCGEVVV